MGKYTFEVPESDVREDGDDPTYPTAIAAQARAEELLAIGTVYRVVDVSGGELIEVGTYVIPEPPPV